MGDDVETAVEAFLEAADGALSEYDQGYADPDATVRRLRAGVEELRAATQGDSP